MKRQSLVYAGLAVFIIAAAVGGFFYTFEYHVQEKDTGLSARAMQNPYLAAEAFLEKFGMQTKTVSSMLKMKSLPPDHDVLLIPTGRYDLSARKIRELMAWVKRGGHLIIRARQIQGGVVMGDDLFFKRLGVVAFRSKPNKHNAKNAYAAVVVHVNKRIENKKVSFDSQRWMKNKSKYPLSWNVEGKHGSQILEYHIGQGYITLLSDLRFMENSHIGEHDNAAFLYTLVHMGNDNQTLWIVRNDDMPSLLSILYRNAPATVVAMGMLVIFWLWYTTRRFGPIQKPAIRVRRSLREHIAAVGLYQWRNQNRNILYRNVKNALLEQIAHARPQWSRLGSRQLAEKLAKLAGIPADRVFSALQAGIVDKENEFTQHIEILSKIRKRL
ncbi:MAG: DUF4350 domain-containing protein [Gammaproteobacteria bacterium]|jgi:hypothetical protein